MAQNRPAHAGILYMDRLALKAALRVLMSLQIGTRANTSDVDLVRAKALSAERDLDLDVIARHVAGRAMGRPPALQP